jgi:trigger factor
MKSTVAPLEGNKVKLSVEVDEAEFDKDIDAAFRKIAREVRLPGFRPGKAPRRLLEARIGLAPAREQALRDAIPGYLAQAVRAHEVDIIAPPEVDITAGEEEGPVAFDATIEVRPVVFVPGYAGLRVEVPAVEVDDAEVEARTDALRRPYGELADVDRPAQKGDFVTLDLEAHRDGEPVPGLNTEDWLYEVGRGWIAADFDDFVEGTAAGDTRTFTTTPTGTDTPADITITMKKVQELALPELTDDWVQENTDGFDTVEAWVEHQRTTLQDVRVAQAREALLDGATTSLAQLVDEEPPEALVAPELRRRAENTVQRLAQQGIGLEQFLAATGQDTDAFVEQLRGAASTAVKVDLALRAVAEAEGLGVDDDELDAEFERIARAVGQKPSVVRKAYEREDAVVGLTAELRKRKALSWLLRHVEVVDPEGRPIDRTLLVGDDPMADDAVVEIAGADPAAADHHDHDHDHDHHHHDHHH